jgi:tetratricopeptide (TPR) repeat protein
MDAKHDRPRTARQWYREGLRLASDGNYAAALGAYSLAIEQDTGFAEAYFGKGACYYALGEYERSRQELNSAALLGSQLAQIWSRLQLNTPEVADTDEM